jgi:glycosyltransferase involved in cell wall biosynthesis
MNNPAKPLTILRLVTTLKETSSPYYQFSLALSQKQDITLCSYFRPAIALPPEITLFGGDGTLRGFFRALRGALKAKEYDIIHVHVAVIGILFLLVCIVYGISLRSAVFTVHNSYQNVKFRNKLMLLPVFAFFRKIVSCGNVSFASYPPIYRWLAGERYCAIQNGVDLDRVERILQSGPQYSKNGQFTVASVGRLIEIKNPLAVLNAFQQNANPASYLMFIGDGDMLALLMAKSRELRLEKQIEFTGLIPRARVYEMLARVDLFISTSRGEGLPVAVLEAMACRCPVVLSDIPPHREIADGVEFIPLVPPDDVAGFAREIKRFQQMPAEERAEIGQECRKLVEKRFNVTAMHEGYEKIYAQVMNGN